ncbi:urease accessory protein UreH domain-containing protein [Anaerocolumna sp. MB42-C2]|uniref:urease accessory protein UreH domain-containing protein n=1 Tax=Anaerocolumna sp. MB42-C2 TaxID=3070997 RepID=UPI0027E1C65E|nr:sulfite exporter TauE/SafE family protein [Anaerocolumna sp. MB42-C2]WMJ87860.1 sulfite exporter TauE/SafE family protein [Anaerocolumna sp. MB42-C2]
MNLIKKKLSVSGMSCAHCELTIENTLSGIKGVETVKASFGKGEVYVSFDEDTVKLIEIKSAISQLEYKVLEDSPETKSTINSQAIYILIMLFGGYVILKHFGLLDFTNFFPQIQNNMGYGMLFLIGLLTSLHCVAMCGGINLAQSVNSVKDGHSVILPNLLYNLGRVVSYTIIGGIVGELGSVISFGGGFRGAIAVFAGVFMVIMGLNMLNVFPWLYRFNIRMPKFIGKKISKEKYKKHSSFYIGLLNGLMPCGPLQSMQLYALSTGSFMAGAISMFLFSLGTVPLMYILGTLSSKLNKRFTEKMMAVCAMLVVVLGIGMLNNGLALSGITVPQIQTGSESADVAEINGDYQTITTFLDYGRYPAITVKAGIPVKWTIRAGKGMINGCNNEMILSEYDLKVKLKEGDNVIEFTPTRAGTYGYSCWMGMIRSSITVME